ncbi:MAG: hypothetical protein IIZ78_00765 [Clostridiales bacterium]|nr:hypothetical protein [Clostridiales bacterium]
MKCDIVILSKSNYLLEKCLSALSMYTSLSSVGKVAIGWTGNDSDLDLNMVGYVCTLPV